MCWRCVDRCLHRWRWTSSLSASHLSPKRHGSVLADFKAPRQHRPDQAGFGTIGDTDFRASWTGAAAVRRSIPAAVRLRDKPVNNGVWSKRVVVVVVVQRLVTRCRTNTGSAYMAWLSQWLFTYGQACLRLRISTSSWNDSESWMNHWRYTADHRKILLYYYWNRHWFNDIPLDFVCGTYAHIRSLLKASGNTHAG